MNIKKSPTPIFVIGAARTGTTNLCNNLTMLEGISGALSNYHYGNCESKILHHKFHWGNFSKFKNLLNFISHVQFSDYFKSANGDINYFITNRPKNYFEFFLDLMDSHTLKEGNEYWVTKLDDLFFLHPKEFREFLEILKNKYGEKGFEFICISRNLEDSIKSYLYMEGRYASKRSRGVFRYFAIILQTLRFLFIYRSASTAINRSFHLKFEDYIKDPAKSTINIPFLKNRQKKSHVENFIINSSFQSKSKKYVDLGRLEVLAVSIGKLISSIRIDIPLLKIYTKRNTKIDPFYYRSFMHEHFPDELIKDLTERKAIDLLAHLKLTSE
ncbi:MAG: hypothetical protein JJU34_05865 [Lunatimonas sp.]|uniref:hypothetical protein n=1 Tax=Lunatimonas sp. TaxID=2060141 RepID=UPI00263B9238|nr:hypothetical protein [Lunatimonas sp.]MCC5936787.1 hypothetical protein [Lunatimonas sp.]